MPDSLCVQTTLSATPDRVLAAWLDAAGHAAMTGAPATVEADAFTAWGGYISGRTLAGGPDGAIVQSWRTTDFPAGAPDSRLEVRLDAVEGGTRVTITHTELPDGSGPRFEQGWRDYYFAPMAEYFGR